MVGVHVGDNAVFCGCVLGGGLGGHGGGLVVWFVVRVVWLTRAMKCAFGETRFK